MTNGTSQGLFVIVAIVIFGIFVGMSYILFQGKMQVGLAKIFTDSFEQAKYEPVNSDGQNVNENERFYWGYSQLTNDNSDYYVHYYEEKATGDMYIVGAYTKDGDTYTQDATGYGLTGYLELPDTINGKKVVGLATNWGTQDGNWTLSNAQMTSVKLPKYLRTIPNGLFDGATKLKTIKGGLPLNITSIGSQAFTNAPLNGSISIPRNVTTIGDNAFNSAEFDGKLNLPSRLSYLGDYAFVNSKFKGDFKLPSTITKIGKDALNNSEFTGDLTLPSNLSTLGSQAFINSKFDTVTDNSKVTSIDDKTIRMKGINLDGSFKFFTK